MQALLSHIVNVGQELRVALHEKQDQFLSSLEIWRAALVYPHARSTNVAKRIP